MVRLCVLPLVFIMLCLVGCKQETKGLIGAWEIAEIHKGDALITDESVPGLFIFTPGHYSMLWVSGTKTEPFAEQWNPTDEEKIQRFNSLIVNSGTYEIEGSTITMYPVVARIPELMGGKQVGKYHVVNDTLQLEFIDEYSFDGVQAPWVAGGGITLTLVRVD